MSSRKSSPSSPSSTVAPPTTSTLTVEELGTRICSEPRIAIPFTPCGDVLLSQIRAKDAEYDAAIFLNEYFERTRHPIFTDDNVLDRFICGEGNTPATDIGRANSLNGCLPPSCITLSGIRGSAKAITTPTSRIKRLYPGDLLFLFFFEKMGIFRILGRLLDDFAFNGKYPMNTADSNNELTWIIMETMVRQTKTGLSSTVRDRNSAYRRGLGWEIEEGRKLRQNSQTNTAFSNLFHKFIQNALIYYNDKRLAVAIQGTAAISKPSIATGVSIGGIAMLLKRSLEPFYYGRNYSNTMNGIVWVIATIDLVKNLRTTLGIPPAYEQPHEYISGAYQLLVENVPITPREENRYDLHKICAETGRHILLDLEVLTEIEIKDASETGPFATWLNLIEGHVESYRTAYRTLTGIDLGAKELPKIQQAAEVLL